MQVKGIADGIRKGTESKAWRIEGYEQLNWVLLDYIDVIVPRGGKNLVKKVKKLSSVNVIGHLEGNCHVYVDKDADLQMAKKIVLNSKMRKTSICGAAETLLIDKKYK